MPRWHPEPCASMVTALPWFHPAPLLLLWWGPQQELQWGCGAGPGLGERHRGELAPHIPFPTAALPVGASESP